MRVIHIIDLNSGVELSLIVGLGDLQSDIYRLETVSNTLFPASQDLVNVFRYPICVCPDDLLTFQV